MEKEVCRGQCLFGKCPYKECVKHAARNKKAIKTSEKMTIMTDVALPQHIVCHSGYGLAVDIGTTTVVAYLYSLADSKVLGLVSAINMQTSFGPDVISRIKFCGDQADGLKTLHTTIADQLNELIGEACKQAGISSDDISRAVITGNTTMLHLLANLSPVSMGVLPFEPESYFGIDVSPIDIGLQIKNASCYLPPCISSFVGADITTDLVATGFAETEKYRLLMDIGTNGEVALGNSKHIVSSSTAAGPAFEGAHISCGMAGVKGAINSVYAMQGKLEHTTIGDHKPRGLCGSGLLDAIAVFCEAGAISETGKINKNDNPFLVEKEGEIALKITEGIAITQKDIREFQTAKAAVSAGVETLIHEAGIEDTQIEAVFIAGGFGNYMNAESARAVGLIPKSLPTISIGNAAATGAALILLDDNFRQKADRIKQISVHTELGNSPYFMEKYVDNMYFSAN